MGGGQTQKNGLVPVGCSDVYIERALDIQGLGERGILWISEGASVPGAGGPVPWEFFRILR